MSVFTKPEGSPEVLRSTAADQRTVGTGTETASADLRLEGGSLSDVWDGDSSLVAVTSLNGLAGLVDELSGAATRAAAAIDTYATALETFQGAVDDLNARHATALARYERRPNPPATPEESIEASDELTVYSQTVSGLWTEFYAAEGLFDDAALALVQVIDADMPPHIPEHAEGINDYVQGLMIDWMKEVPILEDFHQIVEAGMNIAPIPAAGMAVYNKIKALQSGTYNGYSLFGRTVDNLLMGKSPWFTTMMGGGGGGLNQLLMGAGTYDDAGKLIAARGQNLLTVASNGGLGAAAKTAGLLRGAGILGGVASTGLSLANVISQGNPIDAFKANGAGYVADVAEVGFNASLTAAMIAPNPITAGAVVVTGVIYGVATVVENWDGIVEGVGQAVEATGEFIENAGEAIGDAAEAVGDAVGDAVSWLNPFD